MVLRTSIQDENSYVKLDSVEEAYQYALKVEQLLRKKHDQRKRGRGGGFQRSRGVTYGESSRSNNIM